MRNFIMVNYQLLKNKKIIENSFCDNNYFENRKLNFEYYKEEVLVFDWI